MPALTIKKAAEIAAATLPAAGQRPGADSGDPQLGLLTFAPEAAGSIGFWECQPGGWPVTDRPENEFSYIISGRARLTDDATGTVTEIGPGDLVILPAGWNGRWDVTETVRKIFTNY